MEPFGPMAEDVRHASLMALLYAAHSNPKKSPRRTPKHFRLSSDMPRKPQTAQQQIAIAQQFAAAGAGKITHG